MLLVDLQDFVTIVERLGDCNDSDEFSDRMDPSDSSGDENLVKAADLHILSSIIKYIKIKIQNHNL